MAQANRLRRKSTEAPLDRTDHVILGLLQNNARLTNKELAARVGLAPSSTLARVRRLEERGALRAFRAEVDPAALGVRMQALVKVRLRRHARVLYARLKKYLVAQPEVIELYYLAGADDFLVHVGVRDAEHLRALVVDRLALREEVGHLETALVFEHARGPGLSAQRGAP